jgi:hypothetical protein
METHRAVDSALAAVFVDSTLSGGTSWLGAPPTPLLPQRDWSICGQLHSQGWQGW